MKNVSVIIVTHNSAGDLPRCLTLLPAACGALSYEVIVVDTGSDDASADVTRRTMPSATLLEMENRGFAAASNHGAAHASGDMLLFLNPDTQLPPNSLSRLVTLCLQDTVAAVSGVLVNAEGKHEPFNEPFPSLGWYLRRRFGNLKTQDSNLKTPLSVPWLSGAALLVRRDDFARVQGFQEAFFLYYEDIDLCYRLRSLGRELLLDPTTRIRHAGGQSAPLSERIPLSDRAEDVYFALHRPWWERVVLRGLRTVFRLFVPHVHPLFLAGILALGAGVFLAARDELLFGGVMSAALFAVITLSARAPDAGAMLLIGSLLFGQLLRLPLGSAGALTLTDVLLPAVAVGWALALRPAFFKAGFRLSAAHSAILGISAIVLPGLLLAAERLPLRDWTFALSYALRLLAVLALIPLGARVIRKPMRVLLGILWVSVVLAALGFLHLAVFPTASPGAVVTEVCMRIPLPACPDVGWDPHPGRLFSTWLDPNLLGGFFVLALSILLTFPLTRKRSARFALLCAGAVIVSALLLTKSRASLGALFVVGGLSVLFLRSWRRVFPLAAGAVAGLVFVPSFLTRLQSLSATDPTVSLRIQSWQQALEYVMHFPLFGIGYNAYGIEQLTAGNIGTLALHSRAGAESSLLTLLATTGTWGGALLFLILNVLVWRLLRDARDRRQASFAVIALVVLAGGIAHAQFVHSLLYIHILVPLVLILAIAVRSSGDVLHAEALRHPA